MKSVPVLDLYRICTEERGAMQEQAHLFPIVFFCADYQDTLQQGLQNGPGSCSLEICVLRHLHTQTKTAQGTAGVVWLCSGSLCPLSLWCLGAQ